MTVYFWPGPVIHGPSDPSTIPSALVREFQFFFGSGLVRRVVSIFKLVRSGPRFKNLRWSWSGPKFNFVGPSPVGSKIPIQDHDPGPIGYGP